MIDKYRVHEVAKDLGINSKDLIAKLDTVFPGEPKKHMTALTEDELNYVFEDYTQGSSVKDFDAYFALQQAAPKPKPAAAERPAQPAVQVHPVQRGPAQPGQAARPMQQGQSRPMQQGQSRPMQQGQSRPMQQGQSRPMQPGQSRPMQPGQNRPAQQSQQRHVAARPAPVADNRPPIEIHMQQPKHRTPRPEAPAAQGASFTPGSNIVRRAEDAKTVDMRTNNVNLDKYNERYEQMAATPSGRKDTGPTKQKFTQRARRGKPIMSRKEREDEKMRRLALEHQRRQRLEITLPEQITVGELAGLLKVQAGEIIKKLMVLGVMASINDTIDYDTAAMAAMEIGAKVSKQVVVSIEERLFQPEVEDDAGQTERPPIVVVMGHVDHGKTSLLDAIRHTSVASGEAGGITQHIGAYQVSINGKLITFLDTPGHAAFTAMRARGAQVTDIAVIVVAADDGIMPQTVEAINHAKAAGVSIIVAINKMDKPTANPDKVMQQLTEYGLVPEEWGGDCICVPVSAKSKMGIDNLLEMIQLVAGVRQLKANPDRLAKGTVIEAKMDKGRGPLATILVQTGTLRTGDVIIAGTSVGRVRVMLDDKGRKVDEAGPSKPVEITGLAEVPAAGDRFDAVEDEKLAKELVEKRRMEQKEEQFKSYQKVTLDNLYEHISEGEMLELPVIVKADVQGSVEALSQSLEKLSNDEVRVRVIHGGVGAVSESDVMLAEASNAIVVGFNVRPDPIAKQNADAAGVDIRLYRIIYDAIDEIKAAMKGMLAPKTKEVDLGRAEVRNVYKITGVGIVAGCYVLSGKVSRGASVRVVRDGVVVSDDKIASLKRFKDDAKEVVEGYECGITLDKFSDIKEKDVLEAFEIQTIEE